MSGVYQWAEVLTGSGGKYGVKVVLAPVYDAVVAQNLRLRDKLLEWAKECSECDGTGLVTRHFPGDEGVPEWDADDQPCPDCADIREVLE